MIIWFPRQLQVGWLASFPQALTFSWAHCSLWSRLLPTEDGCQKLWHLLSCLWWWSRPAQRSQHLSARGSGPSHHTESDDILYPDDESISRWSFSSIHSQECYNRLVPTIRKLFTSIAVITIVYNLAQHLLNVICAFEAQVQEDLSFPASLVGYLIGLPKIEAR